MPNQFFWHELMTTDTRAAEKFYRDVVGWAAQDAGVPGQDYTVLNANGQGIGGLFRITEEMAGHGARPAWLGYVSTVDDVDARQPQEFATWAAPGPPRTLREVFRASSVSLWLPIRKVRPLLCRQGPARRPHLAIACRPARRALLGLERVDGG